MGFTHPIQTRHRERMLAASRWQGLARGRIPRCAFTSIVAVCSVRWTITQPRIRVETEAVFSLLASVQSGEISMLGAEALEYEVGCIPDGARQAEVMASLSLASERLEVSAAVESLALSFEREGVAVMDAIHLALASAARADFFCTCDDKLLRKAQAVIGLECRAISLLGLVPEVTK